MAGQDPQVETQQSKKTRQNRTISVARWDYRDQVNTGEDCAGMRVGQVTKQMTVRENRGVDGSENAHQCLRALVGRERSEAPLQSRT